MINLEKAGERLRKSTNPGIVRDFRLMSQLEIKTELGHDPAE